MDPKVNVFASFSPTDLYRVEKWLVAMMSGGVSVTWMEDPETIATEAIGGAQLVIVFVSGPAAQSGIISEDIMDARTQSKPVVIVLLDDTDVSECRQLNCEIIDVGFVGRRKAWDQLLERLASRGIHWRDPAQAPWWKPRRINERRSTMRLRRMAIGAGAVWAALIVAWFAFWRPVEKPAPKAQPVVIHQGEPQPVPPVIPPVEPKAEAPPAVVETVPPSPARVTMNDLDTAVITHVRACIEAGNRADRMTDEQIENIVRTYFADEARMQDTGLRNFSGIKAFLTAPQLQWPSWKETIKSITITERPSPEVRVVRVDSVAQGYNPTSIVSTSQHLFTDYTVKLTDGRLQIIAVHGEPARSD